MSSVANTTTRLRLDLPAEAALVHAVRARFAPLFASLALEPDEIEGLKLALSEACSNAICHGSPLGPANRIRVECWLEAARLVMEVEDEGKGMPRAIRRRGPPDGWQTSGRGLYLMRQFTDSLELKPRRPGLLVRMTKRLRTQPAPSTRAVPRPVVTRRAPPHPAWDRSLPATLQFPDHVE